MSSSSERADRVIRGASGAVPMSPVRPAPPTPPPEDHSARGPSVDELIAQARKEAFEDGRRTGAAAARTSTEAARAAAARRTAMQLEQAASQVARLRSAVVDEVVGDLAGLVTDLAELLIGRELVLGATAAREAIVRALALAPRGPDLVVHVHPECGLDDEEISEAAVGSEVTVVRDSDIDVHGCRITAGGCDIDAQIPSALARVRNALDELLPTLASATRQELEAQLPPGLDTETADDGLLLEEVPGGQVAGTPAAPGEEALGGPVCEEALGGPVCEEVR